MTAFTSGLAVSSLGLWVKMVAVLRGGSKSTCHPWLHLAVCSSLQL